MANAEKCTLHDDGCCAEVEKESGSTLVGPFSRPYKRGYADGGIDRKAECCERVLEGISDGMGEKGCFCRTCM